MNEDIGRQRKRKVKRARDRNLARQQRRLAMMEGKLPAGNEHAFFRKYFPSYNEGKLIHRALAWLFSSRSPVAKLTGLVTISVLVFFVSSYLFAGRIFPNVYRHGVGGGRVNAGRGGKGNRRSLGL